MSHFPILKLPTFTDARGSLTVMEGALPFSVVRSYWIFGADGQTRGGHRHRHTQQALVAISGSVTIYMNDGHHIDNVLLEHPGDCLIVQPKDWHTMTFGAGSVLLVMSSHSYDRSEYIDEPYA
ncbi:FdtA/QdtA family cupin domain-containing protein [Hydrogenophaga sp.]|uniref:sugar 3,4-ketoisomerase n=1 Tax=Hydrogenophaga sp. TaxID=1904254 RepID=UPI00271F843C|nr:FdtA/QdtA family cupin domain-containing protein [Hydrogenophaga sp.]MDO9438417.1 FdtA/QdtA family cupin domain-containing protein [Hydrogenophaga sp.]